MALVAYDASSGEESEVDEDSTTAQVIIPEEKPIETTNGTSDDAVLFTSLPQPKGAKSDEIIEEDDEFLHKKAVLEEKKPKARAKVKIELPALSNYASDEDEPKVKKAKPQVKGSGLFAVLPPPKTTPVSTKSFVPHSVAKKTNSKPLVPTQAKKVTKSSVKPQVVPKKDNKEGTETDDSDVDDIEVPETFNEELWNKVCGQKPKRRIVEEPKVVEEAPQVIEIAPEPVKPYGGLDNAGFKQLVGKMRKQDQDIQILDIKEDDIMPDKDIWMVKALTDPTQGPKQAVKDPVNDTCKRKHHITYLAQQAKANEQELQNTWAANKFSRNQSRSKYGF